MRKWIFIALVCGGALPANAQIAWPEGKSAAIVLSYDDGLRSQLDIAIPQLDHARIIGRACRQADTGDAAALGVAPANPLPAGGETNRRSTSR